MKSSTNLLAAVMELPDADRFKIALAILDQTSPAGMDEEEILAEAIRRQDEMESGAVADIGFEELVKGLKFRPAP